MRCTGVRVESSKTTQLGSTWEYLANGKRVLPAGQMEFWFKFVHKDWAIIAIFWKKRLPGSNIPLMKLSHDQRPDTVAVVTAATIQTKVSPVEPSTSGPATQADPLPFNTTHVSLLVRRRGIGIEPTLPLVSGTLPIKLPRQYSKVTPCSRQRSVPTPAVSPAQLRLKCSKLSTLHTSFYLSAGRFGRKCDCALTSYCKIRRR